MKGRLEHSLQAENNIKKILNELPDYVTYYYYEFKSGRQPKACLEYIRKIKKFLLFVDTDIKNIIPRNITKYDITRFLDDISYVIDKNGKEVIPCNYDFACVFDEGLAAIKLNGKWGFIDRDGIEVIPHRYEDVYAFSEGFAAIKLNGKWGFVNKEGIEAVPCKYDESYCFTEGLASVRLQDKFGFVNKEGIEAIPCKYDSVTGFVNRLACVELNGGWGLIDNTGREVTPFNYTLPDIIQKRLNI